VASRWAFLRLQNARPSSSVLRVVWTSARMAMPSTTGTRLPRAVRGPLSLRRAKAVLGAVAVRIGNAAVVLATGHFPLAECCGWCTAGWGFYENDFGKPVEPGSLQSCRGLHCSRFRLRLALRWFPCICKDCVGICTVRLVPGWQL
jgi:hypothetical protein